MGGGISMPTPNQSDKLVSAEVIRHYFDPPPSLRTIRNWQAKRVIPFLKIGGLYGQGDMSFSIRAGSGSICSGIAKSGPAILSGNYPKRLPAAIS